MSIPARAAICAAAALSGTILLGGCPSADEINTAITDSLPTACTALQVADASFAAIAATGKLSQDKINTEAAAMAGVNEICANPAANATIADNLVKVAKAYAAVTKALAAAQSAK